LLCFATSVPLPLERHIQADAHHVALEGLTTEVHVVEYRAAQVFAELRRYAGSGEDAVAIRIRGFEVEGRSIASIQARIDVPRVVHELVLPEHPHLGDNGGIFMGSTRENLADCLGGLSRRHQDTEGG